MSCVGIISIATRDGESGHFLNAAKRLVNRNLAKHHENPISAQNQDQFIFSGGRNNDLDEALQALKNADIRKFGKVYFQAHGNDKVVEVKPHSMQQSNLNPAQLADKFWEQAGLKDAIEKHIQDSGLMKGSKKLGLNPFDLRIRLLSCLTGYKEGEAPPFVEQFLETLKNRVEQSLEAAKIANPQQFKDAAFSIVLRAKAPKGWNVILQDGKNISYFCSTAKEKRVDEALKRIYDQHPTKDMVYRVNNAYVLSADKQAATAAFRVDKLPKIDSFTYSVPYKSAERKNSPRSVLPEPVLGETTTANGAAKKFPSKVKRRSNLKQR